MTAVVNPFGKPVKITAAQRERMNPTEKAELKMFEDSVAKMCASEDPLEREEGEWLRDNIVGNWLFLVDGNSR